MGDRPLFFGAGSDESAHPIDAPVQVTDVGVYRGPHYYSHTPMVRIQLDLGRMEAWPSDTIPGFTQGLLDLLPGLAEHGCSYGHPGGLVKRLQDGTWYGHIAEHVALELQKLAGHRVTRGKTRSLKGRPGVYNVMFAYLDETVGRQAGRFALELLDTLLPDELKGIERLDRIAPADTASDLGARLDVLRKLVRASALGPTTQSLVDEARRRGIPVIRLDDRSLVQFGHGARQQRIRASITGRTSLVAVDLAGNKDLTKKLLGEGGMPVPRGQVVLSQEEASAAAERLGYPLVTKPLDGNHGRGVTTAIMSEAQLHFGFAAALAHSRRVIVEQYFSGRDHRILVVNGEVVAVSERVPARVVGDGVQSIRALIDEVNADPLRGDGHEKVMTKIRIDAQMAEYLARQGLSLDSVPAAEQAVELLPTANLSTGGTAIDRTNEIHADNVQIARRAAAIIGLDIAGIDFITPDISQSVRETGGGIIEVNAAPGLRMHLAPSEGTPRDVAGPVIDMLFPDGARGRIPIVAITGTNGKSTVTRMTAHILRQAGLKVGLTTTNGVYVDDVQIASGDATGPKSARMVLRDPLVEVAVLETARGGLLREGLAFDEADVAAVLNVSADHLGLKGIETLEDLAAVKSLITETVGRQGASVLNADDPLVADMARRARGRLVWFSLRGGDEMPDFLRSHIEAGGTAVLREPGEEGGCLAVYRDGRREALMGATDIPATLHGAATFNIANALAAAAIAIANGVPTATVRAALSSFQSTFEQNPGRLNIHDDHGFRVIADYAHNAAGLTALGELIDAIRHRYTRTIGVLSIPGDRRDEDIIEMGRLGAGIFDRLYFREDPGNRGRPDGEVMTLMRAGALERGAAPDRIGLLGGGEAEAVEAALLAAQPGDLLVVTVTAVAESWKQILAFKRPDPAASSPVGRLRIVGH